MNRLTDIQEIWKYFEPMQKNPRSASWKFWIDSSSRTGDIHCQHNFSNEVGQWITLTDRQEIWNYLKYCTKLPEMSPENLEKIAHLELVIIISARKWGNEQTDRHTRNLKLFWTSKETCQECLWKFEIDSSARTGVILR